MSFFVHITATCAELVPPTLFDGASSKMRFNSAIGALDAVDDITVNDASSNLTLPYLSSAILAVCMAFVAILARDRF